MSSSARAVRLHPDRSDGRGRPHHMPPTTTPRAAARRERATRSRQDSSAFGAARRPDDWYRRLGESHRKREDAGRRQAGTIQDREDTRGLACRQRWPAIIAAMRRLIRAYNDGTGRETLVLVDNHTGESGELTATVTARKSQMLVLAVDEGDLWVRPPQTEPAEGERWIGVDRSDEATAAYILQNWLTRL